MKKGRLTNSMAVRRMDSAREKMMHQNVQSFGTLLERSSERLAEDDDDGKGSTAELAIRCRREKQNEGKGEEKSKGRSLR